MPVVADVAGFPCFEVEFTKDGTVNNAADLDGAPKFVADLGITDLFAISHGWNNDMADARALYASFFAQVRGVLDANAIAHLDGRKFGVLAILWPSKKFADSDLIPSGAAGANASVVTEAHLDAHLDGLKGFFDKPGSDQALEDARQLLPQLENSGDARKRFADLVRSALPPQGPDPEGATAKFTAKDGGALMSQLQNPVIILPPKAGKGGGSAAGIVDDALKGVGKAVSGVTTAIVDAGRGARDAAERLLNYATYYQMKERAGTVGMSGVYQVLRKIRDAAPTLKIHLIGHSFGGRLVSAAALGPDGGAPIVPATMTLLQAAFSHYGLGVQFDGSHDGFFRRVVADHQVSGPILITHTANDKAVGIAYALASRIAGQVGAALGDASDIYGGIGRNGAQKTPAAVFLDLGAVGATYPFAAGGVFNLHADAITGHSDICKDVVASALLSSVATT